MAQAGWLLPVCRVAVVGCCSCAPCIQAACVPECLHAHNIPTLRISAAAAGGSRGAVSVVSAHPPTHPPSHPPIHHTHPCKNPQARLERMVSFLPEKLTGGLAWLAGVPDAADAAERLRKEPMFCMETGAEGGAASTLCVCVGVGEMLLAC